MAKIEQVREIQFQDKWQVRYSNGKYKIFYKKTDEITNFIKGKRTERMVTDRGGYHHTVLIYREE